MNSILNLELISKSIDYTSEKIVKNSDKLINIGLFNGISSAILYYSQAYLCTNENKFIDRMEVLLEKLFNTINELGLNDFSFAEGVSGVGWLINYLVKKNILDNEYITSFNEIELFMRVKMKQYINFSNYEFLYGASGIALYFLSKFPNKFAQESLEDFVVEVDKIGIFLESDKKVWYSRIRYMQNNIIGENISLSHGMSGLLVVLCKIYEAGILKELTKKNIILLSNFILSQRFTSNNVSIFPDLSLSYCNNNSPSRLGWCYGDLGICLALSKLLKYDFVNIDINNIFNDCLISLNVRHEIDSNCCDNPFLCHGAAGIYYGLNKLCQIDNALSNSVVTKWQEKFHVLQDSYYKDNSADLNLGLIDGIIGISLVEISVSCELFAWDECLLLS